MPRRHRHQKSDPRPPRAQHQPPPPPRAPRACPFVHRDHVQHRSKPHEIRGRVHELMKDPSGEVQYVRVLLDERCHWAELFPGKPDYCHDFLPEALEIDPHPDRR